MNRRDEPLGPNSRRLRVVIPGGSGQIGRLLAAHFHRLGHSVTVLSRHIDPASHWQVVAWNGRDLGDWAKTIDGADLVINLAGRSVNCSYTTANRKEILESRVFSTRIVGQAIAQAARPPALWMNASTATIYRHALDRPMDERTGEIGGAEPDAPEAWRFSIEVATSWEKEFFAACTPHTRKLALRSAMTLSPDPGGIFDTLLNLVRRGLGGQAATGTQFISWIHEDDFICAVEFLMDRADFNGCVNLCSPYPLPNKDFMRILRRAWGTPIGLPATRWMLEMGAVLMRTETELILKSRRVFPQRLLEAGFQFRFAGWDAAARDLVERWRSRHGQK
ncbi:MAG TPA: TIGR01777 family oxidoreductase [Candidatus Angelobacter sp.]|nr:TIGR01777 family oxidoreductase [Candidatus Angelobacter sp.]